MSAFTIGDIVKRKSYGGDIYFKIVDVVNDDNKGPVYVLRGLLYRLQADSRAEDLVRPSSSEVDSHVRSEFTKARRQAHPTGLSLGAYLINRLVTRPGRILHIDSSGEFLDKCLNFYSKAGIKSIGKLAPERKQPEYVRYLLEKHQPDILIVTGHDSLKKNAPTLHSLDSYRNSSYFVECVREARKYQPDYDRLCVFAGACQSYYEAIMDAGANFASSPGRVFINALDPAFVAERVSLTETSKKVTPGEISQITISGRKGIWGVDTKGCLRKY